MYICSAGYTTIGSFEVFADHINVNAEPLKAYLKLKLVG